MFLIRYVFTLLIILITSTGYAQVYPESIISEPEIDATDNKIDYDQYSAYRDFYSISLGNADDKVKGFGFINTGGNSTVIKPEPQPGMGPTRFYDFEFKDRARQDIMMWVSDAADSSVSNFMESAFYFFPRLVLPAIEIDAANSNHMIVTLPTTEKVIFDTNSKVILSGVLKEYKPLDMNPNPSLRQFAAISYSGKGVYLRANKRANSPQLASTVTVYAGTSTCQIPGSEVFNQAYDGAMTFKFATDESFDAYLWAKCKFRIPKI